MTVLRSGGLRSAASFLFSIALLASCVTSRRLELPNDESLPHLFAENGNLGWAGITLRMPRSEVERRLGRKLPVVAGYADCGAYESDVVIRGRNVNIAWSSAAPDGVIEILTIPYAGSERTDYDGHLSRAARTAVPELIDGHASEGEACPDPHPSFLVMRGSPEQAVNLKSSGEGVFFVTEAGCID